MAEEGIRVCRRLDGMRAEPAVVGLFRSAAGCQNLKPGPVSPIVWPTPEFATGPGATHAPGLGIGPGCHAGQIPAAVAHVGATKEWGGRDASKIGCGSGNWHAFRADRAGAEPTGCTPG